MTGQSHDPEFTVTVKINDVAYGTGTGKNKKEARAVAAQRTWEMIENQNQLESPSNMQDAELMARHVAVLGRDYVSLLNSYSQRMLQLVDYPVNERTGDAHAPMFSCRCTISGVVYGIGTGTSLSVARQAAAKEAYEKLEKEGALTMGSEKSNSNSVFSEHNNSSQVPTESDSDSVCFRDSAASLVEKVKDMAVCEKPSPSQRDAQSSALKCKRKLAANFDNARKKEEKKKMSDSDESWSDLDTSTSEENASLYTTNEGFLESFKNIEPIGEGGFGNVFKATAKLTETTYAVKRVPFTSNVNPEVHQLARFQHENIVQYYWSWIGTDRMTYPVSRQNSETFLFITMELCEQGTLENWIEKNRQDQKYHEMAQKKFLQILKGVKYIHSEGLIHRDLKPQNIFISREDKIKIGDFGLVTSVANETLTENRGTKPYMAPEQATDKYGKEVDIYALGLIWFEILSAFSSRHERSVVWPNVREGELPEKFTKRFPGEAPIIKKMLSKDPSGRLSASEILEIWKPVSKDNSLKTHTQ
ncbi:interferon-induced, double-stranded RNA-activated protein kinase [Aegotheles albertisi]